MAPVDIVSWAESLDQLLQCKSLLVFEEYLRSEYSEENLLFYLDCEAFRSLPPESDRTAAARRIYREFVAIGAPRQININCVTRAEIRASLSDPGPDCFSSAQRRVHSLMAQDSYPRFLKSPVYQALRLTATST
ncbi:regulator of G-protein signaling 8-like isoform X2 [Periophthalmus magnuspinnatus]|uniref:regulator of G-protein signaling 8-like isoform X2 n=1 Tax=Periophthalmus magnuspinnatus TaxID=409849 RepID=UPI00243698B1|nr:regulator of G-protein signaling 8-like isoform X2 [Periophthalmus magnuspinnatus]